MLRCILLCYAMLCYAIWRHMHPQKWNHAVRWTGEHYNGGRDFQHRFKTLVAFSFTIPIKTFHSIALIAVEYDNFKTIESKYQNPYQEKKMKVLICELSTKIKIETARSNSAWIMVDLSRTSLCIAWITTVVQSVKTRTIACRTPAELLRSEK